MVAGYASSREAPVGKTVTVRVMSVEGSLGHASANSIAAAAKTYAADVVIITGLNATLAHDLTVAGLDRQLPPLWVQVGNNQNTGIGIYSRLTISGLTSLDGFSKPAAAGVLEAGGARVGLTVAQMAGGTLFPGASRPADLKKLAQQKVAGASTGSFIVGDLNTTPWQPGFRSLEKAGWEDAADVAGKGLRPTWPSWSPLPIAPADHLLVDQKIGVASTATLNISGSSHRALVVSLEVPAG
jgi:endonuclease/exonuclease/phosphatase (EEP) superfamily protein YafD